jgi:tetrahydromethanopterin S-methyltransferase subunit D
MSLLINTGLLSEIKAKTDSLPATPADEATATGVKTQTDKLAGAAPVTGSATEDWQTAEADVVSIGAAGVKNKVHDLSLNVSNLVGTVITVRLYKKVKDTERKIYEQAFNATTDPAGLPIINGSWATHDVIRVTLQSNNAADNAKAVDFDFMLEAM